jgi:hypothetical protein
MMIIAKTEAGHRVMKDRSVPLTQRQRSAFILFDGKRSLDQVLAATTAAGVTREDVSHLFELGLVMDASPAVTAAEEVAANTAKRHKERSSQERYVEAYPIATRLTASLGLRGFRLNLAVEAAGSYEALLEIAPKIRNAVGEDKFMPLENALNDR